MSRIYGIYTDINKADTEYTRTDLGAFAKELDIRPTLIGRLLFLPVGLFNRKKIYSLLGLLGQVNVYSFRS